MTTNTGHKHISHTKKGFVFTVPAAYLAKSGGQQTYTNRHLERLLYTRNTILGTDPDVEHLNSIPEIGTPRELEVPEWHWRFAALGDTHLCSKWERLDALEAFYDEARSVGVHHFFHAGNWVDGDLYRINRNDIHTFGFEGQIKYFLEHYPQRKGVQTFLIDGDDHEGWWMKDAGILPGERMVQTAEDMGRTDLHYLGYMEADVSVNLHGRPVMVRVMHGGGGSAKSISLAGQNIVDSWTMSELPDILLVGHYHKAHYLPNYRGVHVVQCGTFQEQTPFMRKKKLIAALGGWIVDVHFNADGRVRVGATYLHYKPHAWAYSQRREKTAVIEVANGDWDD